MELTKQPVILCGLGKVGRRVLDCLRTDDVSVVVIDWKSHADLPADVTFVAGDCRSPAVLAAAGVAGASGIIVCTSDDLINIATVLAIRSIAADVRVVVRTFNPKLMSRLGKSIRNVSALSVSALVAPLIALIARTGSALGSITTPSGVYPVAEFTVADDSPLAGKTLAEAAPRCLPVVLHDLDKTVFLLDVPADRPLAVGNRIVLAGPPDALAALSPPGNWDSVKWAGWFKRSWRIVARGWHEADRAVRLCTVVFLVVLAISMIVFRSSDYTFANAFYQAISVMATGSDLHADRESPFVKSYVGGLRVVGAVLFACFTAILTNYLVRARLSGVLEMTRIPDGGHVVICGLGNVGFRVAEQLLKEKQPVVVIDPNRDGRFVSIVRQRGAVVLNGDGTIDEVLKRAKVDTARAVVAATSDDLVNVEIGLLVREIAPSQRVVVRVNDADLARTLRDAASVQLAISIPALAAPAFVAALYGDRVQTVFLIGGRMLAAVDVTVESNETMLDGETVRAVATDFGLLPVAVLTGDRRPTGPLLDHRLAVGDCLTVLAALSDLDRLYRRERLVADWSVAIEAFPLTARAPLAHMVRMYDESSQQDAERRLDQLPMTLKSGLTRGQAEDLLVLLRRERITASARH